LLEPLARKNALDIRFNTFGQDVDRLISAIENQLRVGADTKLKAGEGQREPRVTLPRINDVDATLKKLLVLEQPKVFAVVAITFDTPDDDFPPSSVSLPALNIFLCGVQQHQSETGWDETRPFRVEHSYVITAWPQEHALNSTADEHMLLPSLLSIPLFPQRHFREN
jgi:hypothetical protein